MAKCRRAAHVCNQMDMALTLTVTATGSDSGHLLQIVVSVSMVLCVAFLLQTYCQQQ